MSSERPTVIRNDEGHVDFEASELTGAVLSGRYRVLEKLGEGAMGAVYRAEHEMMKKTVAVKVLRPDVTHNDEVVQRFRREAQAAANIEHPNICGATDFGEMEDGTFFLVIEYLEGDTLEEAIDRDGPFDVERTLHILEQVADALRQAHSVGVVHRDLKPENIMLVEREDDPDFVKIMDFGVAHVRLDEEHEQERLTRAGYVYGTPHYMSPEQSTGGDIDARSDIYTLGIITYELLTGRIPFDNPNPARVMAMHVTEEPPPIERGDLPAELEQLLAKMLSKEPKDRPTSAQDLLEQVQSIGGSDEEPSVGEATRDVTDALVVRGRQGLERVTTTVKPALTRVRTWLNQQDTATRLAVLAAAGALALTMIALPVAGILYSMGVDTAEERQQRERDLADEREAWVDRAGGDELAEAVESGTPRIIEEELSELETRQEGNPHFHYLLARARAEQHQWEDAFDNYRKALEAESQYAHDGKLLDDVFERFAVRRDETAEPAAELIRENLTTRIASRRLGELARTHRSKAVRKRAVGLLEETGRFGDLDDWNVASIKLRNASGCEEHARYIEEVVDAGDTRGLEVLERKANSSGRGCGFLGLEDCLSCVRDDIDEAIDTLEKHKE